MAQQQKSGTAKPTLLAFHGSGSNESVHFIQLVRLNRVIKDHVNIECLRAPFQSPPGPGILPFFEGCDPFFRWLPPSELVDKAAMRTSASTSSMPTEVETLIRSTVQRIRSSGGRVIGLIGFSQGTKLVAGLLRASELRRQHGIAAEDWCDFSFGVSVCGSYPPPLFPQSVKKLLPEGEEPLEKKIAAPTFHALGKADEWMWAGELLIERHFEEGEGKSEVGVFEEMGHHYPSQEDCDRIGEWVVRMVEKAR